jgi:hypothetical protein
MRGFQFNQQLDNNKWFVYISVAEAHHFYAAPAPDTIFYAAPAPAATAPAPTLLYRKAKFLKRTKF